MESRRWGRLLRIWDEDGMVERAYVSWDGRIYSDIGFSTFSDARLKKNVQPIESALDKIVNLKGVTYDMREEVLFAGEIEAGKELNMDEITDQYGFIAQEMEKVIPHLVLEDTVSRYKSVNYDGVIPVLVEAMKEQQTQIEELQAAGNVDTEANAPVDVDMEMLKEMQQTLAMQQELIKQQQEQNDRQQQLIDNMNQKMARLRGLLENSQSDDNARFEEMLNRIYLSEQAIIELGSCCDDNGDENSLETGDKETLLFQNHPNPFNKVTTITYKLAEAGHTELVIYDDSSLPVETVVVKDQDAGIYNIEWDGSKFTSGVYIYTLKQNNVVLAKKMVLIK